jgi:proline iminopeptidase
MMKSILLRTALGLIAVLLVFVSAMYVATRGPHIVPATVSDDPSLPTIEANGYRFHGEVLGSPENPTVILLHGGPGSGQTSLRPLEPLSDAYQLVFFDQRGAGLSPRVDASDISLDIYLRDLDALVDKYGQGQPVHLIGISWGGEFATLYTARFPDKVSKLALLASGALTAELAAIGPERSLSIRHLWMFIWSSFETLHLEAPDTHGDEDHVFRHVGKNTNLGYFCDEEIPPNYPGARIGMVANRVIMQDLHLVNAEDGGFDLTVGIEDFPKKVLFMAGECDQLLGPDMQRRQMELFPKTELVVLPDAGHEIFGKDPSQAIKVLRRYFAE